MLTSARVKKVLFLWPPEGGDRDDSPSPDSGAPAKTVTISVLTHYRDRPSDHSFVHPSGLGYLLNDAQLVDGEETDSGELRLHFVSGANSVEPEIEGWTLMFPPARSGDPETR